MNRWEVNMKRFMKRGTAVPFFTPIIAMILVIIIMICSLVWHAYTDDVNESVEAEQAQEYANE